MEAISNVTGHKSTGLEKTITVLRGNGSLGMFTMVFVFVCDTTGSGSRNTGGAVTVKVQC